MSTLLDSVHDGLADLGLSVDEDRGGLVVRGGDGTEHTLSVWIDETERVVRAEVVLCYPVDDFTEELCVAMDQLNEMRTGVAISYQEQQRSLVATSVWTSPSRSPSANQLHLLVGLLHQCKERDADPLSRVAEGEAVWVDIADELSDDAPGARPIGRPAGATRNYDQWAEPPTRPMGSIGDSWAEPPTRPMDQIGQGGAANGGAPKRRALPPAGELEKQRDQQKAPPKTSRLAFQMAINAVDDKREHDKVDMTAEGRSLGRRFVKFLIWIAVIGGCLYGLVDRILGPMYPQYFTVAGWEKRDAENAVALPSDLEREYAARKALKPGRELLKQELERPLDFKSIGKSDDFVRASLDGLGDKAEAVLKTLVVRMPTDAARNRAYALWISEGFAKVPGARLSMLRELTAAKRPADVIVEYLIGSLKDEPPTDELLGGAVGWAEDAAWEIFVVRLGRPGEGSKKRAKILTSLLKRDREDALALRCLILTGNAPGDALEQLIAKRKIEWADGEGRELLVDLVKKDIGQVGSLLSHENLDRRRLGVELLIDAKTSAANRRLVKIVKNRDAPTRVRLAAIGGVKKNAITQATWTLVLIAIGKEDETLKIAATHALEKFSGDEAVGRLKPYLAPGKKYTVRHYAVRGLGAINDPSAVAVLIKLLQEDEDAKIRRLAAKVLEDYLKDEDGRSSLNAGLGIFREVAREDKDASVRKAARRLYSSLTGS